MSFVNTFNFTKSAIESLPNPSHNKRIYYKDVKLKGLALAVLGSGKKSFYVIKKINGQSVKIFLGKYPDLSIEQARKQAQITLGQIAIGVNPQVKKREIRAEMTLGQFFDQYMSRYSKVHKKSWRADELVVNRFCKQWFSKRMSEVRRADIQRLHEKVYIENGLTMANSILTKLRAIYNKAIEWGYEGNNPTKGIRKYKERSRDRFIQPDELPHFIQAINDDPDQTIKDLYWMMLLTGARKTNTIMMRWEQLNWTRCEWRIPETKNGEPLTITLTDRAIEVLRRRKRNSTGPWVFPRKDNDNLYIANPQEDWHRLKERATLYLSKHNGHNEASLMDVRMHDLRRTFGSYQAMSGTSLHIIGKSLGHKSMQTTQIYARLNLDSVRESVNKATDLIVSFGNIENRAISVH